MSFEDFMAIVINALLTNIIVVQKLGERIVQCNERFVQHDFQVCLASLEVEVDVVGHAAASEICSQGSCMPIEHGKHQQIWT